MRPMREIEGQRAGHGPFGLTRLARAGENGAHPIRGLQPFHEVTNDYWVVVFHVDCALDNEDLPGFNLRLEQAGEVHFAGVG